MAFPARQLVVRLAKRPVGMVQAGRDLVLDREAAVPSPSALPDGHVLVRNLWLSLDPAMRGWMTDAKSYIPPVELGAVMRGGTIGEVVASKSEGYKPGQLVTGMLGWSEYAEGSEKELYPVMTPPGVPPTAALGVLGMTGFTAYFGLLDVGKPQAGETVVVSAAAGATGSVVAQIAKHVVGCRVVGIAGGAEKCAWLTDELGLDAAVDYKAEGSFDKALAAATPKGIDVFFDNVGGSILDANLRRLRRGGRVVLCGAISRYNATELPPGPANYLSLLVNRGRMEGFIVFDYAKRYPEAAMKLGEWIAEGKIKYKDHIVKGGLEAAPEALATLFSGGNTGKLIVEIAEPTLSAGSKL